MSDQFLDFITTAGAKAIGGQGGQESRGSQTGAAPVGIFDALLKQESGGKQFDKSGRPITSSAGAIGIAQVMPGTAPEAAKMAGIPFDDHKYRTDAEYNKTLGRAYFERQLADFGGVPKALAAYNAGPGAVRRAVEKANKAGQPDSWLNYMPEETRNYVPSILGIYKKRGGDVGAIESFSAGAPGQAQPEPAQQAPGEFFSPQNTHLIGRAPQKALTRSTGEAIADTAIGFGTGVLSGLGMLAGVAGADNVVATTLRDASKDLGDMQSPARREQKQMRAEEIRDAELYGSTWDEIKAYAGSFSDAPIETVVNALGSSAPTILMAAIPGLNGVAAARLIAAGAMGAAQGAGSVKGEIFESVERKLLEKNVDPDTAAKVAAGAQAYDGPNLNQILLGMGIGAAAGSTGFERAVGAIASKQAASAAARGPVAKAALGVASEAPVEGLQGGQEKVASNIALQNEGFDVPTFQGAAGQAALETLASAPIGAAGGLMTPSAPPMPANPAAQSAAIKAQEPNSPLSKAATAGNIGLETAQAAMPAPQPEPEPAPNPIDAATADIRERIKSQSLLDALRREDSPVNTKEFLRDLAVASSQSTNPAQREQAMTRLEFAMGWAEQNAPESTPLSLDELPGIVSGDEAPVGQRPGIPQLRAGADRDKDIQDQSAGAMTDFDRRQAAEQQQVNLEARMRAPAAPAAAPLAQPAPQATPDDQARLEAASLAGKDGNRKSEDSARQMVIYRAMRNVEERGGVASPAEARIFQEAGVGKPYDRIDETLSGGLSADERLTQATGISLGRAPRETSRPGQRTDADLAAQEQRDRSDSRMKALAAEREAAQGSQPGAREAAAAPAADEVIAALKAIPALRTAEQKSLVDIARRNYTAEQMRVMSDAAVNPANLSATDKLQLQQIRSNSGASRSAERSEDPEQWWHVKAFDKASNTTTTLNKMGLIDDVQREVEADGWVFVDARPDESEDNGPTKSAERSESRALPDVAIPAGEGPAFLRKRKAQIAAAAGQGYETVERRDGVFVMRNAKTGAEVRLSGRADAALARQAIRKMVDDRAHAAATSPKNDRKEPSWAQIEANNAKKGDRFQLNGVTIVIENPQGSVRRSKPGAKSKWETTMTHHYGDIAGTKGADGDPVDVFIGPNPASSKVFVVDQVNADGSFDEHKVLMGFDNEAAARQGYLSNYSKGWTGLSAIKEMGQDEFQSWVKDRDATATPAAAPDIANSVEPEVGSFTVRMDGKDVKFERRGVESMGEKESPERDGKAIRISKKSATLVKAIAGALGKKVVFFSDVDGVRPGDGFVVPTDPDTIYLNEVSTISPLAVMGHEFMHTLRESNQKAWDAVAAVVKSRVKDAKGFRRDYYGAEEAEARGDGALAEDRGGELEELVSDLGGNLMTDPKFWGDVFDKIRTDNGAEAKGIIARLIATLQSMIDKIAGVVKGPKYRADGFVTELDAIRAAYRDALAGYLQKAGESKAGMQAEVLKSARRGSVPTSLEKYNSGLLVFRDMDLRPAVGLRASAESAFERPRVLPGVYELPFADVDVQGQESLSSASEQKRIAALTSEIKESREIEPLFVGVHTDGSMYLMEGQHRARALKALGYDTFPARVVADETPGGTPKILYGNGAQSARLSPERGIHFSKRELTSINGAYYGTGLKGAEAERLRDSNDARLKTRVYAYIDEGNGVRPEAGVGGVAHEVQLPKLYDAKANAEKLWNSGDINATESRILDAGYGGYFVKKHETGQGLAVVIGDAAQSIPAKRITDPKIMSGVPNMPPETVSKGLMSKEMNAIEIGGIPGARMRAGILTIPPESADAANAELERIGSSIRFSKERISTPAEELKEIEDKFKGTDQWMLAPNGEKTKLTSRQWVHVRTPSFKKWFGDWESFAGREGGVWNDDKKKVSKVVDDNGEPMVVYHGTDAAGFSEFERAGGTGRGDLGIWTSPDFRRAGSYVRKGRARDIGEDDIGDKKSGVYALFVNLRDPHQAHFEGANWDGSRAGLDQFEVFDSDGDRIYDDEGGSFFSRDAARAKAKEIDGTYEPADDHYETTDSVAKDARKYRNDGAIIMGVSDNGGGVTDGTDPADNYIVFDPNQVKSADFNGGEYSLDDDDIRLSVERKHERIHEFEVSTRTPYAKATKNFEPEDARANLLISDFAAGLGQEKWLGAVTDLVETYPNYRAAPGATTPEKKLERMVRQMVDNLVWLHDQVPASTRTRSKLWYDGARAIAERWVKKYGITDAQAAGMLAVLSPQKDWFMNVSLANRVADILSERQSFRWSKQMDETASRIFGKEAYDEDIAQIRGETLQDIDDPYLRAMWVRVYDQAHNPASFYIVSPEGDFIAEARTKDGTLGRVAWGGNSTIAKAVSIFEDGGFENISESLGRMHKVRNFYNNILVPNSPNGHVTIDTHAVAAALLRPLSGNSLEVMHNFGGPSSAHAGLKGSYALYEEAYRRAAAERGILPREMQSITWEAIRGLYVPTFKAQSRNVKAVDAVWGQYSKGRLSYEKARQQVFELGGRIDPPGWEGRDPGAYVEDESAADDGDLAEDGAPGGGSATDGRVAGKRAGAAARRSTERGDRGRRGQGRSLAPLAGAPNVQGAAGPDPRLVEVAESYAASKGISLRRQAEYVQVDEDRARRIAAAYEAMPHAPQDPKVKAAYADLIQQTREQYDALIEAGYEFTFFDGASDPYQGNPWNAMRDLRANQRMAVYGTYDGYGTEGVTQGAVDGNPMLADTGLRWKDQAGKDHPVLANDLFRAVHDAFGHGLEGAGFRAQGEENAWQAHARLFTGGAVAAITTETRGQNSWLNYGPYGEKNRTAGLEDTVFADQKTGLMPEWTWTEGRAGDAQSATDDAYNQRVSALKELISCLKK